MCTNVDLHQYECVCVCMYLVTQLCPWTAVSMDSPGKRLEWVAMPPPGDLPSPGIEARSPALQVDSSPAEPSMGVEYKLKSHRWNCWTKDVVQ